MRVKLLDAGSRGDEEGPDVRGLSTVVHQLEGSDDDGEGGSFREFEDKTECAAVCSVVSIAMVWLPLVFALSWVLVGFTPDNAFAFSFATHSQSMRTFNWHPLCMTLAFCCIFSTALLSFRLLPAAFSRKQIHMTLQIASWSVATVGLVTVILFKQYYKDGVEEPSPQAHFYSAHSWLGISTYAIFTLQLGVGLSFFATPRLFVGFFPAQENFIRSVLPWHIAAGWFIFLGAVLSVVTGVNSRQWLETLLQGDIGLYTSKYTLGNVLAVSVVAVAITVYTHLRRRQSDDDAEFTKLF